MNYPLLTTHSTNLHLTLVLEQLLYASAQTVVTTPIAVASDNKIQYRAWSKSTSFKPTSFSLNSYNPSYFNQPLKVNTRGSGKICRTFLYMTLTHYSSNRLLMPSSVGSDHLLLAWSHWNRLQILYWHKSVSQAYLMTRFLTTFKPLFKVNLGARSSAFGASRFVTLKRL